MKKNYYIAKPEYCDMVYGSQFPEPIDMKEMKRLSVEWNIKLSELMEQFYTIVPNWYLVDVCGYDMEITLIPKQYQNKKAAIKYGKIQFKSLSRHDQKNRTEFYVSYCVYGIDIDESIGLAEQYQIYDCMK